VESVTRPITFSRCSAQLLVNGAQLGLKTRYLGEWRSDLEIGRRCGRSNAQSGSCVVHGAFVPVQPRLGWP
jgi:hypothetical protein